MFKSLIVYRIAQGWVPDLQAAEEALAKAPFMECGATQEKSIGWVPPRGEAHGALVESIGGQWIARLMEETKAIPASVLARKVKEKADRIEQETGRKPGKKETRELKDEAKLDLLPMAFTKQASMWVWIDPAARLLVLDTGSQGRADEVVTLLVEALPGLSVSLINTQTSPQAAMAHWLKEQEPPVGFTVDRECELKSASEEKAVVKYARHPLDLEEVQAHIDAGKLPTKLAMTWDDRVSFLLTEGLQVRKLQFLDTVFEGQKADAGGFDTDVAIATGELVKLIPDLIEALGGETASEVGIAALEAKSAAIVEALPKDPYYEDGGQDPLYDQAAELVRKDRKASISYVQRKLLIGYNRAARLLKSMEKAGVVSRMDSAGARTVLDGAPA
ncbi:recombination-associated protein RdgC [Acidovorax sp. FJL06]|uniref:recombination-associated protein RdgC n=1 Tax=Acidovorax sp. FJL06 TaxID=2153365 RepID=UPI000F56A061|nr:recombination-associated protein RdgC [Acidovorax sp. FJL06]RQO83529.1 recombination-associated protein RdgC [Acidovorax sp. FJL06]